MCHGLPVAETLDFDTMDETVYDFFKCAFCEKDFQSKDGLGMHVSNFHGMREHFEHIRINKKQKNQKTIEENTIKCSFCGRRFFTKKGLTQHIASVHEEKIPGKPAPYIQLGS